MRALEGYRILDLTHVLAGPLATYQLALLGAEVIKVEPPGNPDMVRGVGSVTELNAAGMGADFQAQAANKRAITLNLADPRGADILRRLARTADVLVENYQTGSLERLGLGPEGLMADNPRLIYCSLSGYGRTGPLAKRPSYDATIKAHSGWLTAQNRSVQADEMTIGPPVFDYATGAMAAMAITSALLRRERTGNGQRLDVAMLDSALMLMSSDVTNLLASGEQPDPARWERQGHPGYRLYETAKGVLMAGAWTAAQTGRFWQVLGMPDRAREVACKTIPELEAMPLAVIAEAQAVMLTRSADEWERLLNEAHVPAARVRTLAEAVADPQVAHRGAVVQPEDGPAHMVAAYTADPDGPTVTSPPPSLGQDTAAVLEELGIGADERAELRARGVI